MRSVLIASLVSGVLGGGGAVVAGRYVGLRPAESPVTPDPGAKALAAELIDKLKTGDIDKFATAVYANTYVMPDPEVAGLRASLVKAREQHAKSHGKSTGEFGLIREQAVSPSIVRLVYLEKFDRGGVAWYFVLYHGPEGWKLADVKWDPTLAVAFAGF